MKWTTVTHHRLNLALHLAMALMGSVVGAQGQTVTIEADPDLYFDRGITLSAGVQPADTTHWTLLGDFASRKVGPLSDDVRLQWRVGAGARYRVAGQRNNLFGQLNVSFDRYHATAETTSKLTLRPGIGVQWFPWTTRGFHVEPLVSLEGPPGQRVAHPRGEFRLGWQFFR
jgi:hypothetical protein